MSKARKRKGNSRRSPKRGTTTYSRLGTEVERSATSEGKRKNSKEQFAQRQRLRHSIALWKALKPCNPMFTKSRIAYNGFTAKANLLPAVYVKHYYPMNEACFLMPNIPVSEGTLGHTEEQLGEVQGTPALITNIKMDELNPREDLLLYTAEQHTENRLWVSFKVREVKRTELVDANGFVALTDDEFADEMKGWALVRVNDKRCSTQAIVTRCTYYEQYTTSEAMETAAQSYGGLTS